VLPCRRTRGWPLRKRSIGKEKNVAHSCQCVTSTLREAGVESRAFHGALSGFAAGLLRPKTKMHVTESETFVP
jgi:hypothetical protein